MYTFRLAVFAAASAAFAAGCGPKSQTPAQVTGTVTYKGQPLKGGSLTFHTEDKGNYNGSINSDGTYSVVDIPTGTMKVSIETESLNPGRKVPDYSSTKGGAMRGGGDPRARADAGAAPAPAGKGKVGMADRMAAEQKAHSSIQVGPSDKASEYVKIPAKYSNVKTSGLVVTLEAGPQVKDFELID